MKRRLVILQEVHDEVVEAAAYYHQQREGLGEALHEAWKAGVDRIQQTPEGYQIKRKFFRQALLERFPYIILFELTDTEIIIYRFINVRRHPKKRYAKPKK